MTDWNKIQPLHESDGDGESSDFSAYDRAAHKSGGVEELHLSDEVSIDLEALEVSMIDPLTFTTYQKIRRKKHDYFA